jgi:hypothetical protein
VSEASEDPDAQAAQAVWEASGALEVLVVRAVWVALEDPGAQAALEALEA